MTDHDVLETFDQRLQTYVAEHRDCQEGELLAYLEVLLAATPGLRDAFGRRAALTEVTVALIADRGDGLPFSGPTEEDNEDGEPFWTKPERWTLADFRLNLAWWHRRPAVPAARLAALIAYGELRWPGKDLSPVHGPETHHLPAWGPILAAEAGMDDEAAEEAPDA